MILSYKQIFKNTRQQLFKLKYILIKDILISKNITKVGKYQTYKNKQKSRNAFFLLPNLIQGMIIYYTIFFIIKYHSQICDLRRWCIAHCLQPFPFFPFNLIQAKFCYPLSICFGYLVIHYMLPKTKSPRVCKFSTSFSKLTC